MRTERGLDRLIAFADAVVAIAITLLVLPLVDVLGSAAPDKDLGAGPGRGRRPVRSLSAQLLRRRPPLRPPGLAVYGTDRLAIGGYIGTMTASSACLSLLSLQIWRRPPLRRTGTDIRPDLPFASLVTTGMLAVALVIGGLVPEINYFALLLLFLTGPIESRWRPRAGGVG